MWHLVSLWGRFSLGFTCTYTFVCLILVLSAILCAWRAHSAIGCVRVISTWNLIQLVCKQESDFLSFKKKKRSKNTLPTVIVTRFVHKLKLIHIEFCILVFCDAFGWWIFHTFVPTTEQPQSPISCSFCFFFVPNVVSAFVLEHQLFFSLCAVCAFFLFFQFASAFILEFYINGNMHRPYQR